MSGDGEVLNEGELTTAFGLLEAGDAGLLQERVEEVRRRHGGTRGFEEYELILAAAGVEPIAAMDRAIAIRPGWALAYIVRGDARLDTGDAEAARLDYQQAMLAAPRTALADAAGERPAALPQRE